MYNSHEIANRIKSTAKSKGISLKIMLSDCELGINTVSQMSKGNDMLSKNLARIADYLDCSVDYLLGRTDRTEVNKKDDSINKDIDFEKLHRSVLKKLTVDNYALCRNNAPYKESDIALYEAITTGATEAARQMLEEYHRELVSSD